MKKYKEMTSLELKSLRSKYYKKMKDLENKAEAYLRLIDEINQEQIRRLIIQIRRKIKIKEKGK